MNEILYQNMSLGDACWILGAYLVCATLLLCLPLLALSPSLVALKRSGMLAYGRLGSAYMLAFSEKWLGETTATALPLEAVKARALDELGGEYGTLTDLNTAYLIAERIPIVPVSRTVLAGIAIPAVLPMVPVVLVALGFHDTVKKLLEMLT